MGATGKRTNTRREQQAAGRAGVSTVTVLGATGSIGTSTLDLVGRSGGAIEIVALTAQSNVEELARLARQHRARLAVIGDEQLYEELKAKLAGSGIEAAAGERALVDAAAEPADCVMAAIVGAAGLRPTFRAIDQGRRLALANKECLVSAGAIFMQRIAEAGTELIPVDSEHSAAFQAIGSAEPESIERIVLTASGGPFRTWSKAEIAAVRPDQALKHPNWSMGRKITVDSASLMNKGLELIEAFHLFPVEASQLGVVVHPQSIVHCLVEYRDGSVLAQLSCPDMRTPIAFSLAWPRRMTAPTERLDLVKLSSLTFEAPDGERFPSLLIAREALERGGGAPAVLNAANEVAVAAFLDHGLPFPAIPELVGRTLNEAERRGLLASPATLEEVLLLDESARALARTLLGTYV